MQIYFPAEHASTKYQYDLTNYTCIEYEIYILEVVASL